MKLDLSIYEIGKLLKEGSIPQKDFIEKLYYEEFKEFIELWEEEYNDLDLRSCLNGGVLSVEDDPEDDFIIWRNNRIGIVLI